MANLAALELERHLTCTTHGRKIIYRIFIPAAETKNRVSITAEIGGIHAQIIQRYLATFRPLLAKDLDRALFPKPSGGARAPKHLGEGISKLIAHHTGLKMHPHLFRHLAAKLFLETRPGEYESVRRLLNHRKIDTTAKIYSPLSNRSAQDTYHGILDKQGGYK
ncbi:hypothetical protein LZA78_15515 [Sinirhodobacter sp. WL0062]|uniref:Tyr recombinase domain-containing protein n=1 Tax=Rhodobacter flavimaris TaxID=2907145 RepID=A0ABS8YYN0_9RHOB|nr:hypothetical protein [Sinirhodobacter sp. WL0062]MCE5974896.1 hypothetical protein [Sinirhodobacter sp. WL0062]